MCRKPFLCLWLWIWLMNINQTPTRVYDMNALALKKPHYPYIGLLFPGPYILTVLLRGIDGNPGTYCIGSWLPGWASRCHFKTEFWNIRAWIATACRTVQWNGRRKVLLRPEYEVLCKRSIYGQQDLGTGVVIRNMASCGVRRLPTLWTLRSFPLLCLAWAF